MNGDSATASLPGAVAGRDPNAIRSKMSPHTDQRTRESRGRTPPFLAADRRAMTREDLYSERALAYRTLAGNDQDLRRLLDSLEIGPDPFSWAVLEDLAGGQAFPELSLHIISQQISTAAATTIYSRLSAGLYGRFEPSSLLFCPPETLRAVGLSGAKARSLRDLASRIEDGRLSLEGLAEVDDVTAEKELQSVLGVGPWSAQMFLLHYLRRPDVMPAADVGLLRSAQTALSLSERPTPLELAKRAEQWRPFRSYAAALLWEHGSNGQPRTPPARS